jgi:hypothetical protein
MKKNNKQRLYEMMNKVSGMPLNENSYSDYLDTNYSADGLEDAAADENTKYQAELKYNLGLDKFKEGKTEEAEKFRQMALEIGSDLGWGETELPPYSMDEDKNKTNEFSNLYHDYAEYAEYFNKEKSKIEDDGEGSSEITYVFDIPKSIYSDSMFDDIEGSSHGVEGNPGGMVSRTSVSDPVDMGDYVEITVLEQHILDI